MCRIEERKEGNNLQFSSDYVTKMSNDNTSPSLSDLKLAKNVINLSEQLNIAYIHQDNARCINTILQEYGRIIGQSDHSEW